MMNMQAIQVISGEVGFKESKYLVIHEGFVTFSSTFNQ